MNRDNNLLLLSGTPASGKDTITNLLIELNPRFQHFKKHRSSNQPKADENYIHVSPEEFSNMATHGEFLQYHYRYDRGYGVAHSELKRHWAKSEIPIIHVGKYENIALLRAKEVVSISALLMVSLLETKHRLKKRHNGDIKEEAQRIDAYHEERAELAALVSSGNELAFDLIIDNTTEQAEVVARLLSTFCIERASS